MRTLELGKYTRNQNGGDRKLQVIARGEVFDVLRLDGRGEIDIFNGDIGRHVSMEDIK